MKVGERRNGSLLLRGIRWRFGMSILTALISAIAVGAAVLGPLYLRAAGDSVVRSSVRSSSVATLGVTLLSSAGPVVGLHQMQQAEQAYSNASGIGRWYGSPITTVTSGVGLRDPASSPLASQLFFRTGICEILTFRVGGCQPRPGAVVVSDRTATELGVTTGSVIDASVRGAAAPIPLSVTGIYAPPDLNLPYWWGAGPAYFPFGTPEGPNRILQVDPLITSAGTALAVPIQDVPTVIGQVPLLAASVDLGNEGSLEHALSKATMAVSKDSVIATTQLPAVLAGAAHQRHTMSTIVTVAAVQLAALSIWVLAGLLIRSSDSRREEIHLARLRGFPTRSMLWVTAGEPSLLCALGVPIGVVGAWFAATAGRDQVMTRGTSIVADGWAAVALAVTLVTVAATVALSTGRVLRSSALSVSTRRTWSASRRSNLVGDAAMLVLSVVAVVDLTTSGALSGRTDPIASAAPALIALGVAVIGLQALLAACRLAVRTTTESTRVAAFLAMRQVARRPGTLRQARVLVIASSLACFAVAAWSVARTNRLHAATFSVGTTAVATVVPEGTELQSAVDHVDPSGRFAMAAERVSTSSSDLLAVDASRLSRVVSWPPGSSARAAEAGRALDPPTAPPVMLPADTVQVAASVVPPDRPATDFELGMWVFDASLGTTIVHSGPLNPGPGMYSFPLAGVCPGGCRLAGVGVIPAPDAQLAGSSEIRVTIGGFSSRSSSGTVEDLSADLSPGGWQATAPQVNLPGAPRGTLTLAASLDTVAGYVGALGSTSPPMAFPADHPNLLPAVVTSDYQALNGGRSSPTGSPAQGLDGNTIDLEPAVTVPAMPELGADAVMVDLDLLSRYQIDPSLPLVTDQVWLGSDAPRDVVSRLRSAGLQVKSLQRASSLDSQAEHSGPALADDFFLLATIAALLVAAVSTVGVVGSAFRMRSTELAALEVAGVPRRVLARSLAVESFVLAATALFGTVAGVIASVLALRSLPELASTAPFPLQYGLPAGPVAGVTAAAIIVVLVAAGGAVTALLRETSPSLLRSAPNDTEA